MLGHDWPGNVRELEHLIARLVIFSDPSTEAISASDVQRHLFQTKKLDRDTVLDREMDKGFDLEALLTEIQWHYANRAGQMGSHLGRSGQKKKDSRRRKSLLNRK